MEHKEKPKIFLKYIAPNLSRLRLYGDEFILIHAGTHYNIVEDKEGNKYQWYKWRFDNNPGSSWEI